MKNSNQPNNTALAANRKKMLARQAVCFVVCLMLMLVVPIWHSHKIIGIDLPDESGDEIVETLTLTDNGFIINTTELGKDIIGYGGTTPVEIIVSDGKITKIKPLENRETPEFFGAVRNSDLFESLDGKTLEEAASTPLDAVSGATYSSKAVIGNIKAGINYGLHEKAAVEERVAEPLTYKFWVTLAIILAAGIVPWFVKDRRYRTLQLVLNVLILGFWGGTFISYSLMTSYLTNGITQVVMIPIALMLVAAFIYPFFGKVNYYCNWMCPYGSLQELLGKCIRFKIRIPAPVLKGLTWFRQGLWFVLMWLLWTGLWFDWMGYEPFAAFFFNDASLAVLIIAGVFLLLSFVVQRPYCRFVCPTGSLFKYSEGNF